MRIDEIHPGDVIAGKYRVRTILGRNNGLLLEGFHTEFDQRVVIKILLASQGEDRALERFRREARTLAKLESEHVARIIDVGTEPDGSFYLVRQYLEGVDVSTYLRQNGPLSVPDACLCILMVAEAVAETHSHGIIVRELQPGHLFVTQRAGGGPLVKITDFGTAKLMRDAAAPGAGGELTATAMFGLSPYSSPELLRKAKNVDVRTDVWSLGAILYELMTGRAPFTGETAMLMLQITKEDPTPASQLKPGIPPELDQIISWALAKDVDARFKNVHAFAQTLQPYAPAEGQVLIDRIRQITEAAKGKRKGGAGAAAGPAFTNAQPAAPATSSNPATLALAPAAMPTPTPARQDQAVNARSPQQDYLMAPPPPGMGGPPGGGTPATMPLPVMTSMPGGGPSGPSMGVGPMPSSPAIGQMPGRSASASSPASRKVAMGALAVAAVVLPLIVLYVVIVNINKPTLPTSPTSPTSSEVTTTTDMPSAIPVPDTGAPPPTTPTTASATPVTPASATPLVEVSSSPVAVNSAKPSTPTQPGTGTKRPQPPASDETGTLLAVAVGGNCAFSVNGASKGTSQSIRVALKPGTYSVNCKPDSGNMISKSVTVKSGETAMAAFKL